MEEKSLRSQLHTLVGNEMRLGKRAMMNGYQTLHVEAHEKAEKELEEFLKNNPLMMEHIEAVEEYFSKKLYD